MTLINDRFKELRNLLRSYEETGYTFDDAPDRPGAALAAFFRQAARHPGQAAAVAAEIDDLLSKGLFSEEIAEDVDLLPHINPPAGATVDDTSLREASGTLGLRISPPKGVSLRRWLNDVREIIAHRKYST